MAPIKRLPSALNSKKLTFKQVSIHLALHQNMKRLAILFVLATCAVIVESVEVDLRQQTLAPTSTLTPFFMDNDELGSKSSENLFSKNQHQQQQHIVSHKSPLNSRQFGDTVSDIQIECNSNNIVVTLQTNQGFNGMIYPKGLSKNSTCMMEYHQMSSNITYYLPLKSCNTMSTDVEDGVEYFNTVMVQPHRRLVTNQGRGYHIRCRYQTKERTITNQEQQLSVNLTQSTPSVMGAASMPTCSMRIYAAGDLTREVAAENVRIGDELHLIIELDDQDVYGMLVTNCLVRDGMNWGEQALIDDRGCPIDEEIMPEFVYASNLTRASVTFQAHKFPYTSSVYYQCNVRLCFRDDTGGCAHVPPNCSHQTAHSDKRQQVANNQLADNTYKAGRDEKVGDMTLSSPRRGNRARRWVDAGQIDGIASRQIEPATGMSIEVSSGLRVDEDLEAQASGRSERSESTASDNEPLMMASTNDDPEESGDKQQRRQSEREFCMSLRKFAIVVSLISLLLMLAIIIMIAFLIRRRQRQKLEEQMRSQYDQYDHNYEQQQYHTNRGYSRD